MGKSPEYKWSLDLSPNLYMMPQPKKVRIEPGLPMNLAKGAVIRLKGVKDQRAAKFLKKGLEKLGVKVGKGTEITLIEDKSYYSANPEAYSLYDNKKGVAIKAKTPAGLFYGVGTLLQMIARSGPDLLFPLVQVEDFPDLKLRGFSIDFRYAWLTEAQIMDILDNAAAFKVNTIVWWLQDKFAWKKHPNLVHARALTAAQWKKLVAYAEERFIQMVPYVDLYGHGENYLDRPKYVSMSNGEMGYWDAAPSMGDDVQYCASDPRSEKMIKQLWDECLPVFNNTDLVHAGMDEVGTEDRHLCKTCQAKVVAIGKKSGEAAPYPKARNKYIADRFNKFLPYFEKKKKRVLFWDDSAINIRTRLLGEGGWDSVPPSTIPILWYYDAAMDPVRNALAQPYARKYQFVIGPNSGNLENTANYLALSRNYPNVIGVITTLWEQKVFKVGESWPGFGLAAALGWNRSTPAEFAKNAIKARLG